MNSPAGQNVGVLLRGVYAGIIAGDEDLKLIQAANLKQNLSPLRFSQHARTLIGLTGQAPVWKDKTGGAKVEGSKSETNHNPNAKRKQQNGSGNQQPAQK